MVYDVKEHKQRHFMGHNDDICCLNIHPNRRFMVSGQVKAAGPSEVPRACIWDSVSMQQLQCIGHPRDTRSVTAAAFTPGKGKFLLTCTSDNEHTLFLWNWMTAEKDPKAPPAWQYGPFRKLKDLEASPSGFFYQNEAHPCPPTRAAGAPKADELRPGVVSPQVGQAPEKGVVHSTVHHGMTALQGWDYRIKGGKKVTQASATPSGDLLHSAGVKAAQEKPLFDVHNPEAHKTGDGTYELVMEPVGAINGLPPAVYGIVFNPYDKSERPEFITYGVKHIKWWTWSAEAGTYLDDNGKFGPTNVVNVLSAVFVQDPMGGSVMDPDTGAPLNFRELIKGDVSGKQTNKGHCKVTASGKVIKYQRMPGRQAAGTASRSPARNTSPTCQGGTGGRSGCSPLASSRGSCRGTWVSGSGARRSPTPRSWCAWSARTNPGPSTSYRTARTPSEVCALSRSGRTAARLCRRGPTGPSTSGTCSRPWTTSRG